MGISDNLFRPPDMWGFCGLLALLLLKGRIVSRKTCGWPRPVGGGHPIILLCILKQFVGSTCINGISSCGERTRV